MRPRIRDAAAALAFIGLSCLVSWVSVSLYISAVAR